MALTELAERRRQERINDPRFKGWAYIRVLECPKGEVGTHIAGALAKGTVLPALWGGPDPSTGSPLEPTLQMLTRNQQNKGAMDELTATYIGIDPA